MRVERKDKTATLVKAHLLVLQARYYEALCDELVKGATEAIALAGASCELATLPGALELPGAIAMAAETGRFDGYVALGCVLRGETSHYDIVAGESARGLMDLTLRGLAVGNGILTCDNEQQAWARARVAELNKGGGAAQAALALIGLKRHLKDGRAEAGQAAAGQ